MELTVVHKAAPHVVPTALERFHSRGIDAVAVDDPNWIALFLAFGTYRIRIAVPDEQVDEAHRVLEEWDREAGPNLKRLSRQVYKQFFLAGLVALTVATVLLLLGHVWLTLPAFLVVWLAAVVFLGVVERARQERASAGEHDGEAP